MSRLSHSLTEQVDEDRIVFELEGAIPDSWAMLEADVACSEKKVKVTLYLDASVAKFFRGMGKGYQERINRLLRLYAQAKIAEVRWWEEAWDRELDASVREELAEHQARHGREDGGDGS
jgi:uncharacterized protein (DUF4415 family)